MITKCIFCGQERPGHVGVHLITNDGNVVFYCSSKCRKNALKLKRDKRKVRWTNAFYETREKAIERASEMAKKEEALKQPEKAKKEQKKEKSEKK